MQENKSKYLFQCINSLVLHKIAAYCHISYLYIFELDHFQNKEYFVFLPAFIFRVEKVVKQPRLNLQYLYVLCPGATKDMGKMLGGEEEKDPDAAKKEEERQEALRQQEEERKAKHTRMEAEREKVRQTIRDKVPTHSPGLMDASRHKCIR